MFNFQGCSLLSILCTKTMDFKLLTGSGISTDPQTSYAARIMALSIVPFIIVQLPIIFKFSSGRRLAVLCALIASVALVLCYCLYQVLHLSHAYCKP